MKHRGGCAGAYPAWLIVAGLFVVAVAAGLFGSVVWQRQQLELARLSVQVEEMSGELSLASGQLVNVQATAAALQGRLADLESTAQPSEKVIGAWEEVAAQYALLAARVDRLERQVAALTTAEAVVAADAVATAQAVGGVEPDALPATLAAQPLPATVRLDVEPQKQRHNLSCESCAASMAARYHGVDAGEEDVLAALPRDDNPHLGFRGNVDGTPGGTQDYGVYAAPVAAVLASYGLDVRMVEGGLPGICAALARGNPVVAWMTYDCMVSTPVTVTVAGQRVRLVPYQHAVVVTGYDAAGVWANDPWDGREDYYAEADFERALGYLGQMAIEVAVSGD